MRLLPCLDLPVFGNQFILNLVPGGRSSRSSKPGPPLELETSTGQFEDWSLDFAAFARACGAMGVTITEPNTCGSILDEALNGPGPALVEAVVDPYEPPLPGKIKPQQALPFAESLARGEPRRMHIATNIMKDKVRELV